MADHTAGHALV